jgi:hypothetical protein
MIAAVMCQTINSILLWFVTIQVSFKCAMVIPFRQYRGKPVKQSSKRSDSENNIPDNRLAKSVGTDAQNLKIANCLKIVIIALNFVIKILPGKVPLHIEIITQLRR